MKPALMILIFLRTFVSDKQKILLVGRPTTAFSNFMKRALMILIFLRIFVNDRQKSIVGQATNNGIFKFIVGQATNNGKNYFDVIFSDPSLICI